MRDLIQKIMLVAKKRKLFLLFMACTIILCVGVGVLGYSSGQQNYREQSYSDGYSYGRDAGYKDGYLQGEASGTSAGKDEGYEAGHDEGYTAGHDEGYTAGHDEGYQAGKDQGYDAGYAEGQTASASNETVSASTDTSTEETVYVTRTGECYHSANCSYLNNKTGVRTMTESEAISEGYRACSRCGG